MALIGTHVASEEYCQKQLIKEKHLMEGIIVRLEMHHKTPSTTNCKLSTTSDN